MKLRTKLVKVPKVFNLLCNKFYRFIKGNKTVKAQDKTSDENGIILFDCYNYSQYNFIAKTISIYDIQVHKRATEKVESSESEGNTVYICCNCLHVCSSRG